MATPTRRLVTALAAAAFSLVALGTASTQEARAQDTGHDPILFIHGWNENSAQWASFITQFVADGWNPERLHTMDYVSAESNQEIAEKVARHVDDIRHEHGVAEIDIITHSMGGVSSRWYLKFGGGTEYVDDWVSLGGPNHGTVWASTPFCFTPDSCREMRIGSEFLAELNAEDETPGPVNYGTWWSPCDEVIIPQDSTVLEGASNTETACMEHIQLSLDPRVYRDVRDFVR
ncbi:triacylglycerol lipase [Haloechinothrix alba]|uniref:Triacylglycerol lipase n=1 Tax=Haloechinothrix alba TaxID=664784 RepID=A0A238VH63_9PSEU|nr:alpha/beta fold hydrolase [Haloechinothrix alba]SNR33023.1 triacylglycerol lipase [Haloechinothrix alba]